jgi:chromosome segregation ATPase
MTRKFLEDKGLSKEVIDAILDENSKDIGKAKGELDSVKAELETANKDKEGLQQQINDTNSKLAELQKSNTDVDTLKTQIEDLQNQINTDSENHKAEIKQLKIDSAVDAALNSAKAKNVKAVKALLELENAELLDDGTVKGLDEQIKALVKGEDSKFLFDSTKTKIKGASVGENGNEEEDTEVDTSKMTYSEMVAYLKENPDAKI